MAVYQDINFDKPPSLCWGLQQNLCHFARKKGTQEKNEIGFAREARAFTSQTYTFSKRIYISCRSDTVRV